MTRNTSPETIWIRCIMSQPLSGPCRSVRYLIDDARAAVDFYTTHHGFTVDPTAGAIGITNGRARALVAAVVGLISLVIGGLALARSAGRIGAGSGRAGAIVALVALVLGLIGMVLSVVHLGTS